MSGDDHDHPAPPANALRAEALETLLVEQGVVRPEVIDAMLARFEQDLGPMNGARLVARAWCDPEFKRRLLADGWTAAAELGFFPMTGAPLVAVENTPGVHNVVVCTLCSCYPSDLIGLAPAWYKDPAYRSRLVREPRRVLAEMGLTVPPGVEVRVWDSSAEMRYLVIPERPAGTEALGEEALAALVTRDALIGVARARAATESAGG
jgi:nitrile hydratase